MVAMSVKEEISLPCPIGRVDNAPVFIKGNVEDNSRGYRIGLCSGCQRLGKDLVQEEVELSKRKRMGILVVDQSRFIGGEKKLVIGSCVSPAMTERNVAE
jgi:hypothetical protein